MEENLRGVELGVYPDSVGCGGGGLLILHIGSSLPKYAAVASFASLFSQ